MARTASASPDGADVAADLGPVACARELLEAIRADGDPTPYRERLAGFDDADLAPIREDRNAALAFWSNVYNAGTQLLLAERPTLYESRLRFFRFFNADCITVARTALSLDTIEHGLLRGSRSKYGLGYLPRFPRPGFERRYRLSDPDPRLHFVLNCGAESCPAIRSFRADDVDEQLERATRGYLESTVAFDADANVVRLPRLFRWYHGDFGGRSGIRELLREYDLIPADASPGLRYLEWDWSRAPGKFVD